MTTSARGIAVLGAQPVALVRLGVRDVPGPDTLSAIGPLHDALGVFGYAALKSNSWRCTSAPARAGW